MPDLWRRPSRREAVLYWLKVLAIAAATAAVWTAIFLGLATFVERAWP